MPTPPHQSALFAGPGRFPALAFYGVPRGQPVRKDTIRLRAARLLQEIEAMQLETEQILVSLAPAVLSGHSANVPEPSITPDHAGQTGFEFEFDTGRVAVMVQVSAATPEDRVHALRLVRSILHVDDVLESFDEFIDDVRTGYREPFGYPDSRKGHIASDVEHAAIVPENRSLPGCSWIFYQRFTQDLSAFFQETPDERNAIMGIDLQGDTHTGNGPSEPDSESHVKLARAANRSAAGRPMIIRRGFPYRDRRGDEGLAFVAVTNEPGNFKALLQRMLGTSSDPQHDAVLRFIAAERGGLFFVPATSAWLADGDALPSVQVPDYVRSIERPADEALELYPLTPKGIEYMNRMRTELIYGDPVGRLDPVPNPDDEIGSPVSALALAKTDEIHTAIAGGYPNPNALLPQMDAWLASLLGQNPKWRQEAPQRVIDLVDELGAQANSGPLTGAKIQAIATANPTLEAEAIFEANRSVASDVKKLPAEARDLVNGYSHVLRGPVQADPAIKDELDALRDESIAASQRVNQGEGYYITING